MPNFANPVLWSHPQWMMSCDEVDFGSVRLGKPVEKEVLVSNVGGGAQALHCVLTCQVPWLQLRRGEAAPWESALEVRLQAGEELLLMVRANPEGAQGNWNGQSGQVRIEAIGASVANAPDGEPNPRGHRELAPLRAKAYFLEPRYLTLQTSRIQDPSGTTALLNPPVTTPVTASTAAQQQVVAIDSEGVPLGSNVQVEFRLGRSDGLPTRATLEHCKVTQGQPQWFQPVLENRAEGQILKLLFFTANRQPGQPHLLEIAVRDADELVEPALIRWSVTVTTPPLLGFEPLQISVVGLRPSPAEFTLSNRGQGQLKIDYARVPGEFSSWLVLHPTVVWPVELAAGAIQALTVAAVGKELAPGQTVQGHVEVSCNHMGRRVLRRVPVTAIVASHGVRVGLEEDELSIVLDHNTSTQIPFQIFNEAAEQAWIRVAVSVPGEEAGQPVWLSCEAERLNLPGGSQVQTHCTVSARELPLPLKTASHYRGILTILLLSAQANAENGGTQIWSRPISLQVQPKPKRFGLF